MLIHELAKDIHENAVAHGWWEGEHDLYEIIALIHSEWGEALEEARAGRPMVWYRCLDTEEAKERFCIIFPPDVCDDVTPCGNRDYKPEGIAVELMDGVIRILDFLEGQNHTFVDAKTKEYSTIESLYEDDDLNELKDVPLPRLVALLHALCSKTIMGDDGETEYNFTPLMFAAVTAISWVHLQGFDPLEILLMKHGYNKGRPYKHGKKF